MGGGVAVSPDGKRIVYRRNSAICIANSDGSYENIIASEPAKWFGPTSWSPNGTQLVYIKEEYISDGVPRSIGTMNSDGTNKNRLIGDKDNLIIVYDVSWLPDGRIAFVQNNHGVGVDIYLMNSDGSNVKRLTNLGNVFGGNDALAEPQATDKIFFRTIERNLPDKLWSIDYDGSNLKLLSSENILDASYSPERKLIAATDGQRLIIMDREGNVRYERFITENMHEVRWSPFLSPTYLPSDIDQNTIVDIMDLIKVANKYGSTEKGRWDVNSDGVVDIADLILVATHLGEFSAPSRNPFDGEDSLATTYQAMLRAETESAAKTDNFYSAMNSLEKELSKQTPTRTHLMQNYPNPFNPETYIPFALANEGDVKINIYSPDGRRVREIDLGYLQAGSYATRDKAVFWDGRNSLGEKAASGTYFVEMNAGWQRYLGKMVVGK